MLVRLIALDIDGTLLDSRWKLPGANRAAIQEATRRGIEVALVTGRRYDFALPVAQDLGCAITLIVNNGGIICSKGRPTPLQHILPTYLARPALPNGCAWPACDSAEFYPRRAPSP